MKPMVHDSGDLENLELVPEWNCFSIPIPIRDYLEPAEVCSDSRFQVSGGDFRKILDHIRQV